jgi:hypothetical protein
MMWLLAAYGIGYVCSWRRLLRWFIEEEPVEDAGDFVLVLFVTTAITVLWPPVALWLFAKWLLTGGSRDPAVIARKIAGESRNEKEKRLERERIEREQYITKLEQELEIA